MKIHYILLYNAAAPTITITQVHTIRSDLLYFACKQHIGDVQIVLMHTSPKRKISRANCILFSIVDFFIVVVVSLTYLLLLLL